MEKMRIFKTIQRILAAVDYSRNQQQFSDRQMSSAPIENEIKLKYIQVTGRYMAAMGFTPNQQQNDQWCRLSFIQIFCIVKCCMDVIEIGVYVFFEADRIDEYMDSIFALTVIVGILIALINIIFKSDKLFNMFETAAEEANFSKC